MFLVVILAIISIIAFLNAVSVKPEYITHQTLQELMYLLSIVALGFCGVIAYLRDISKKITIKNQPKNENQIEN